MKRFLLAAVCLIPLSAVASTGKLDLDTALETVATQIAAETGEEAVVLQNVRFALPGKPHPVSANALPEDAALAEYRIASVEGNAKSRRFNATLTDSGGKTVMVEGRMETLVEVPVLTRTVRRGEVIYARDVITDFAAKRLIRPETILDANALNGKAATRTIAEGRPVSMRDLARPTLVEKGNKVYAYVRTGTMELRTTLEALEDGAEGDIIRAKNIDSGKVIAAQVAHNGDLIVNYRDTPARETTRTEAPAPQLSIRTLPEGNPVPDGIPPELPGANL